jgi:hypothetical protein
MGPLRRLQGLPCPAEHFLTESGLVSRGRGCHAG